MRGQRHRALAYAGPKPLVVVAGMPRNVAPQIASTLERGLPHWRAISVPFGDNDQEIYDSDGAVNALLRQTCAFAEEARSKSAEAKIPAPSRIVLCYVEDHSSSRLLDAFGHSAFPVPLQYLEWDWRGGKHWRSLIEVVADLVVAALGDLDSEDNKELRQRLEAHRVLDPLFLPGRNFYTKSTELLAERFNNIVTSHDRWDCLDDVLEVRKFTRENFSAYFSKVPGNKKHFFVDARGLVFPTSNFGQHGPARTIPANIPLETAELRRLLETLYRFGTPLPAGFQHDVQWDKDKQLKDEVFNCSDQGKISVSGSHANVYPNDVVREP